MQPNTDWINSLNNGQEQVENESQKAEWRGDDYYSDTKSWSSSMFKMLEEDELEFDDWFKGNRPTKCEDVYAKGQYLHDYMARMIKPDYKSECNFLFLENTDKRTKAYKDTIASVENIDSVYVLTVKEKEMIESLADSFLRSEEFQTVLRTAESYDVEVGYRRNYSGFPLKGKLDFEFKAKDKKHIFDWKTSSSFSDFRSKAWWYKYHRQAVIYSHIANADTFTFVVFDTVKFKRWKIVKVARAGKFWDTGIASLDSGIKLAEQYLVNGVNSKCFKVEVL